MITAIFIDDGDERYHIGTVEIAESVLPSAFRNLEDRVHGTNEPDIDTLIEDYYFEWSEEEEEEEPDCDSMFIDWLIKNKEGFSQPAQVVTYAVIRT